MPKRRVTIVNPISEDGNWTPPRGYHGHFLPQSEWDPNELREVADNIEAGRTGTKKPRRKARSRPTMPEGYTEYEEMYGAAPSVSPVYPTSSEETERMREAAGELMGACRAARKLLGYEQNPVEALSIINPKRRSLAKRGQSTFVKVVDFVKDHPIIILFGVGFLVALYVAIRTGLVRRVPFVAGAGTVSLVGGIATPRTGMPYQIDSNDRLWMVRMLWGEVARSERAWATQDTQRGGAAVLWAMINHYLTVGRKREIYPNLGAFLQGYSQPISYQWADPGSSRCQRNPSACTDAKIRFRQALRTRAWGEFPPELRNLVDEFVAGRVQNPIGTRTDFRASGTGYYPSDMMVVEGNVFGTNPAARLA
jgi:hypothetical protein